MHFDRLSLGVQARNRETFAALWSRVNSADAAPSPARRADELRASVWSAAACCRCRTPGLSRRRLPRYKCFRCRILAWRGQEPPYEFNRRTPCPNFHFHPRQVSPRCEWLPAPQPVAFVAFVLDSEGLFCYTPPSLVECPNHGSGERASEPLPVASNPTRLWAQGQKTPLRPLVRAAKMTGFALRSPLPA